MMFCMNVYLKNDGNENNHLTTTLTVSPCCYFLYKKYRFDATTTATQVATHFCVVCQKNEGKGTSIRNSYNQEKFIFVLYCCTGKMLGFHTEKKTLNTRFLQQQQ